MQYSSERVKQIPPYAFAEIKQEKEKLIAQGIDVIDLGMGDPDLPTHKHIVDKMKETLDDSANFKYPNPLGLLEYRQAVAHFYKKQYGIELDPETEVLTLIGSKEGTAHLVPALVDPGDYMLVPDPAYPVYEKATLLANGKYYKLPLLEKNNYLPQLSDVPKDVLEKTRLMFLNYPNNPTTACVDVKFFQEVCEFAKENNIVVAHDSAYNMVTYDHYKAPSILEANNARDVAVEIGTLSKTFNMTGFRIGYIVGNAKVIKSLAVLKGNVDTGQFMPIQKAATHALLGDYSCIDEYNEIYKERLTTVIEAWKSIGIDVEMPKSTYFVWAKVPEGNTSAEFAKFLLEKAGVVVTPGSIFGEYGESYFRIAVAVNTDRLKEAVERIKKVL